MDLNGEFRLNTIQFFHRVLNKNNSVQRGGPEICIIGEWLKSILVEHQSLVHLRHNLCEKRHQFVFPHPTQGH